MIGGNITGTIQAKSSTKNEIGESQHTWVDVISTIGWLGMSSGEQRYTSFGAKVEESTHTFLCDFNAEIYALANLDTRMILKGFVYDVLYIDNPDEMDKQLEISLKRVGAWHG